MFKKVFSLLLVITMITGLSNALTVNAAENDRSGYTPKVSTLTLKTDNNISRYYNSEGEEVDLRDLDTVAFSRRRVALPSAFDLRDEGRSTSVKDQGYYGFCWSFASVASMESNILTKNIGNATTDNLDLSESGGAWFSCNGVTDPADATFGDHRNDPYNGTEGGNALHAAESISSGYGAYPEELAKYENVSEGYSEAMRYYSDYRLKDFSFIPEDFNLIKQRIMEKGAMYYAYRSFMDNYYETEDGKYTYSDNGKSIFGEETEGGHAVTVVGWDDNFSKDNFHPDSDVKNDGAWLCKNSWGEYWGNDGFFWISYESSIYDFGQFEMQDKDSFDTIHQHQTSSDQYLMGGDDVENPQYFSSANVFTAKTTEELKQICYSNAVTSDVKVKIYELDKDYESPVDGKLLAEFDSDVNYAGTHCVDVPEKITFNEGDIFSVVIEGEALITNFRYEDIENPVDDIAGKSYFTDNGTDWVDVADFADASYAAIKAYTTKTAVDKSELEKLIRDIEEYKPSNEAEQNMYDNNYSALLSVVEKAKELLVDENVTNTELKNFCCVLNSDWDAIKMETFSINNIEDFETFYKGVHSKNFDNRYVELNTDLDLSGFYAEKLVYDDGEQNIDVLPSIFIVSENMYFNGNGHTIKNLDTGENTASLFGNMSSSMIKNLNIENCKTQGVDYQMSILAGLAIDTEFVNVNIRNCVADSPKSSYVGLLTSSSSGCTFTSCSAENCKVVSGGKADLFFTDVDGGSTQAVGCTAENYSVSGYEYVDDNMGFNCSYQYEIGLGMLLLEVTDNDCTVKEWCGEVKSVKLDGVEIVPAGSEYHIDKSNGSVILDVEFSDEPCEFDGYGDFENRTVEVTGYLGTEKDIVIPEKILGFDVVGLYGEFYTQSMNPGDINSVTVPGVIRTIPAGCFVALSGLTKITLESGVEEIGDGAFENCKELSEINLPDSISAIGENAFFNCGAKSVVLGKNIQSIGDFALGYRETDSGVAKIDGFTIYGYSGTASEAYAKENNFAFVDLGV